jgi:hypothetical protein
VSEAEENWLGEPPDDGRPDFRLGPGFITLNNYGGNVTIVMDGHQMHLMQEQVIVQGDWNGLQQRLTQYGLSAADIQELGASLEDDGRRIGPATQGWIGRTAEKIGGGALTNVTTDLIVKLIRGFVGI